jgi:cysteine-rich repeat protein
MKMGMGRALLLSTLLGAWGCAGGDCAEGSSDCNVIKLDAGVSPAEDRPAEDRPADAVDAVDAGAADATTFSCADAGAGTRCAEGLRCNAAGACRCGDGRLDDGEQCDDGRNVTGSGCEPDCRYTCSDARPCAGEGDLCRAPDRCDPVSHRCVRGFARPGGTPCGEGRVCDNDGACFACPDEGRPCDSPQPCSLAAYTCSSGRRECTFTRLAPPGTACGTNGVCGGNGQCAQCLENATCVSLTPCRVAATRCATGVPVCTDVGNAPAGTPCGEGRACDDAGTCRACAEGAACSTGNPCVSGVTRCGTGAPMCAAGANVPAGTACPSGVCNGAGTCVPCAPGAACTPANPCQVGATACDSGGPVCAARGNAAAGATCPGGVCDGAGTCVRCGDGFIDRAVGEVCDDGNVTGGDGCSADCRSVECTLGTRRWEDPVTHACYWREPDVTRRETAVARCQSLRGAMAMFETEQELNAVYPSMGLGGSNRVWIGLQGRANRGPWFWDNGVGLTYTGFRGGEPSGDGTCVEWGPGNNFNDVGCSNARDFVCERAAAGRAR